MDFNVNTIKFRKGKKVPAYEYWCQDCKQLRLAFVPVETCGNCGSLRIIKGDINTLKKE